MGRAVTVSLKETPRFLLLALDDKLTSSPSVEELSREELEELRTKSGREAMGPDGRDSRTKPRSQEPPPRFLTKDTFSEGLLWQLESLSGHSSV